MFRLRYAENTKSGEILVPALTEIQLEKWQENPQYKSSLTFFSQFDNSFDSARRYANFPICNRKYL
jgi:hypothetical protein